MQFKEVIGQEKIISQLVQMHKNGRVPHALMFLGNEGSGNLALALAFAQYHICEDKKDDESCGVCHNCRKAQKMVHPDVHFSFPVIGKAVSNDFVGLWRNAVLENPYISYSQWIASLDTEGNKQGNISKDECDSIIKKLSLKTFEGKKKVLIIWLPEYLGKEGNRLLKIIEEPPENTMIILVAENQDAILQTILSRCQILKIPGIDDEAVVKALEQREQVDSEKATATALMAAGNYNAALEYLHTATSEIPKLFVDWLRKCYVGNPLELVKSAENLATLGKENQKFFLKYGLHFLRELLLVKFSSGGHSRLLAEELTIANKLTNVIDLEQLEDISEILSDCHYDLERNAYSKLLFLDAGISIHRILKKKVAVSGT